MTKEKPNSRKPLNDGFLVKGPSKPRTGIAPADLAILALGYLAADPERMGDFLAVTGLQAGAVPSLAATGRLTHGVLSYLAAEETLLVAFADHEGLDPAMVGQVIQRATDDPFEG